MASIAATLLRPLESTLVAALAVELLTRRPAFALALLAGWRSIGARLRSIGIGPLEAAEVLAIAAALSMPLAIGLLAFGGCRRRTVLRTVWTTVTVAIVVRAAFIGTSAGPPDFDHLRFSRHCSSVDLSFRCCRCRGFSDRCH